MPKLHYFIGDATAPRKKPSIIAHVCNDCNCFAAGFTVAISKKFPQVKSNYHNWFKTSNPNLGDVQFVKVAEDLWFANMIGQHDVGWNKNVAPIRYEALETCLKVVYEKAEKDGMTVTGPRFGADLAGGDWKTIEGILKKVMTVDTYIYTLEAQRYKWATEYEE